MGYIHMDWKIRIISIRAGKYGLHPYGLKNVGYIHMNWKIWVTIPFELEKMGFNPCGISSSSGISCFVAFPDIADLDKRKS